MADNRQFGSPKAAQFGGLSGEETPGDAAGDTTHCAECEAMLMDALDGTLPAADQEIFDSHMAHCGPCAQMLGDARRGAAWLEMLRDPRPEPPAQLLERILAQTSGAPGSVAAGIDLERPGAMVAATATAVWGGVPAVAAGYAAGGAMGYAKVIPFRSRFVEAFRSGALGHIMLQPRLAMTAAMAFFSIALTLNLTGVRLQDLHASDLRPASLKHNFGLASAHVVQYYEGLRVVYELESRVHDLQAASDNDTPAGTQAAPQSLSPGSSGQPDQAPAGPTDGKAAPDRKQADPPSVNAPGRSQPNGSQPDRRKAGPGTSRREDLNQSRLVAAISGGLEVNRNTHARLEGALA